jgi:hypothetical protein
MKKTMLVILTFVLLFLACVYIFIPSRIAIASSTIVNLPDLALQRLIPDESKWSNWWTGSINDKTAAHQQNGYQFTLAGKYYKALEMQIEKGATKIPVRLSIVPLTVDSSGLEWKCELPSGALPWDRIRHYYEAKSIKQALDEVSGKMKNFFTKTENVYGLAIERNRLMDTLFVSNKKMYTYRPAQKEIYSLINTIKGWMKTKGAPVTGNPIYNITQLEDNQYQLMAGIPTDRRLPETEGYAMKFMVKGSFMISEVVGGDSVVSDAWKRMTQYFQDYRKTSMAMNFTMLVTDRTLQRDSSKWVTKLYMPVY